MPNNRATGIAWRLTLVFALVVITSAAALLFAAANGNLTQPVTRWLSGQLGRTLVADGGLRIRLGRVTRLTATGLHLANTTWGVRPDMLLARNMLIDLDTLSLFKDTVIVRQVTVEGLDLLLERTADGQNNWAFNLARNNPSAALSIVFDRISLPGAKIRFTGPRLERPLDIALVTAEQRQVEGGMLDFVARGEANATPLDLHMTIGPIENLVATRDFTFTLRGQLGEIQLDTNGRVDSLATPADSALTFRLKGPDAAYLTSRLGVRNLGTGPLALTAAISPAPDRGGIRGYVQGSIGEFEVAARGVLADSATPDNLAVQARVSGPDLSLAGGIAGINGLPAESFHLILDIQRSGDTLRIRNADLALTDTRATLRGNLGQLNDLAGSELRFRASGSDFARVQKLAAIKGIGSGAFELAGTFRRSREGATDVQISGTTNLGTFSATGPLGRAPDYAGTKLQVTMAGTDFAALGTALKLPYAPAGAFKADGGIQWDSAGLVLDGANLTVADQRLLLDGRLGRVPFADGVDVRGELTGNNAAGLADDFGLKGLPASAFRVAGRIRRQKGRSVLNDVQATLAGATLKLSGTLGDRPSLAGTNLIFDISGPALDKFSGLLGGHALPRGPFRAGGKAARSSSLLQLTDLQLAAAGATGTGSAEFALPLSSASAGFTVSARGPDLALLLPDLQETAAAGKNFEVNAAGSHLNDRWALERLQLKTDQGFVNLQGDLVLAPRFSAQSLLIEASTRSLRSAGLLINRQWPEQPLTLRTTFAGTASEFTLDKLTARLGATDIAGRVQLRQRAGKPDLDLTLESPLLDLDSYLAARAPTVEPAKGNRGDKRLVIPAENLTLPDLTRFTARATLRAGDFRIIQQRYRDLRIEATVRDGRLRLEPLEVGTLDGQITARLDLAQNNHGLVAQLSGSGDNLAIPPIPANLGGTGNGRYSALFDLRASGRSFRDLAGTLNGRFRLVGQGGSIANSRLTATSDDFLRQLFMTINPLAHRQPSTEVVCAAYLLSVKDGVVTTDPGFVMRTAELDIISNGTVDLRTEKIDFNFKTAARKGLGFGMAQLVNPYIKVNGTLASPGLTLDPKGTLVNGGAAFATAGLSIVATTVWDRVVRTKDPCVAAVAEADRRAGG